MADLALLVGINKYPGCPLNGCVNDITDMVDYLVKWKKFDKGGVQMLVDERATTDAIKTRLMWLVKSAKSGDRVLFHYSGHGAQVPSHDPAHNIHGMADVICPVDFDWSPARMVDDKFFFDLFSTMPTGVKFNWISDSCHSGDLFRDIPLPGNPHKVTPRAYPMPVDIAFHNEVARHKGHVPQGMARAARALDNGLLEVGFISGCRSDQTSADAFIQGRYNGALTYFLLQALKQESMERTFNPRPIKDVVLAVNQALTQNGYEQRPQVEGSRVGLPLLW